MLPGISRQKTIFLSDLRFFVLWFHGSMVQSICDCSAVQSAVCLSKCLAAVPVFLLCKICAEIVVYRMFAVFLNGLNGKNSSRSIVRNIFSVYLFYSRFQDQLQRVFFCHKDCYLENQDRPIRLTQCCTQFKPFGIKTFCFRNFHTFK